MLFKSLNIFIISFILFLMNSSFNARAEVISYFERCLRFNANHHTNSLTFHSSVNPGNSGWVYTSKDPSNNGRVFFIANYDMLNFDLPNNTPFNGVWPTEYPNFDEHGQPRNEMEVEIICQWDIVDGTPIFEGQVVTNRLLNTPSFTHGERPEGDIDIYSFLAEEKCYCIEMPLHSDTILLVSSNGLDYAPANFVQTHEPISLAPCPVKRFYKDDWEIGRTYFIKILPAPGIENYYTTMHGYKFTIKKVRPIVLVHGINSHPVSTNDYETAFLNIKNDLPYIYNMRPVWFYDFPWNHTEGSYLDYSGNRTNNTLYAFTSNICSNFSLKSIVFSHSLGGLLTVSQLKNESHFFNLVKSFVFFGTPFCGIDKASDESVHDIIDASEDNINYLKRGTKNIWDFMSNIPYDSLHRRNSIFIIGNDPTLEINSVFINGGKDCDGIVPISSANLPDTLDQSGNTLEVNFNHMDIKDIKHPYSEDSLSIFNQLKNRIN